MNSDHQKEHPILERIVTAMVLSAVVAGPPGGMWLGDQLYQVNANLSGKPPDVYERDKRGECSVVDFFNKYKHL